MKIKVRLLLNAVILVGLTIFTGSVVLIFFQRITFLEQKGIFAGELVRSFYQLNALTDDYLLHREERAESQWKIKYQSIGKELLVQKLFLDPIEQDSFDSIKKDYRSSREIFNQLTEVLENSQSFELEERLLDQLHTRSTSMVDSVVILSSRAFVERQTLLQQAALVILILIFSIPVVVTISFYFLYSSLAKRIIKLHRGTEIIAEGNLDFKVGDETRDEIGQLSRAFDKMTAKLKLSYETLKNREQQLNTVYSQVSDILYYYTVEPGNKFRFTSVNPAFYAATGLKPEQVIGKLVDEVVPEPSLSLVLSKYKEAIERKETVVWEETTPYPTGTKVGEVSITPIFDDGNLVNMVGTVHDITERKAFEDQLKSDKANDEAILGAIGEGLLVVDPAGNVIMANSRFEKMFE